MAFLQMPIGDRQVYLVKQDGAIATLRHIAELTIASVNSYDTLFTTLSELCSSDVGLFIESNEEKGP